MDRSGQFAGPMIPIYPWMGPEGINLSAFQDLFIFPGLESLFEDVEEFVRKFGSTFASIASEGLIDGSMFIAGAGAAALPAWIAPGFWKIPVMIPGMALAGYSVWRFAAFVSTMREKQEYLSTLKDRIEAGGEKWASANEELKDLENRMGTERASEVMFEREKAAVETARRFKADVQKKKILARAEIEDMFDKFVFAPTPKAKAALGLELQGALVNILDAANQCLKEEGWRKQGECLRKSLMSRTVRKTTALDALRYMARGQYNSVPGIGSLQADAQQHFKGVD
jgi:uncharacterized protein (DUF1330 family)